MSGPDRGDEGDAGVVAWLDGFVAEGAPRGDDALALARALVDALGHPQRSAPAVHIVGTAGKGTVAALLTGRLCAAGISVATHQSPHVDDVRERFLIDGRIPDWSAVESAARAVEAAVTAVRVAHGRPPSFFAVTAALSWELGRRHDVDIFVTEAGIGGRRDATVVLDRADTLTVVTNIGLDHTDVLGPTVEEIAAEKAAVLTGRTHAVLGPQTNPAATDIVRAVARRGGVVLDEVTGEFADWRTEAEATVDAAIVRLEQMLGRALPAVPLSLSPGRYEVVSAGERRVVLDGAHNPLKLAALARLVADDTAPACVVAAVAMGKDLPGCAAALVALGAPVVATEFGGATPGPQSWPADDLAQAVTEAGGDATVAHSVVEAAWHARVVTSPGETILVTGSFLILADFRAAVAR